MEAWAGADLIASHNIDMAPDGIDGGLSRSTTWR
jgi:hypothetical protein